MKEYLDEEAFIIKCIAVVIVVYVLYRLIPW